MSPIFQLFFAGPLALLFTLTSESTVTISHSNGIISAVQLLPALHRNVTTGNVWLYPDPNTHIQAREPACQCFEPSRHSPIPATTPLQLTNPPDSCCMPSTKTLSPFCAPNGSTCCGDTFCLSHETCCAGNCCPQTTTCNLKIVETGCCPLGAFCSGPATCLNHSALECARTLLKPGYCCPAEFPFCQDHVDYGLSCFESESEVDPVRDEDIASITPVSGFVPFLQSLLTASLSVEPGMKAPMVTTTSSHTLAEAITASASQSTGHSSTTDTHQYPFCLATGPSRQQICATAVANNMAARFFGLSMIEWQIAISLVVLMVLF